MLKSINLLILLTITLGIMQLSANAQEPQQALRDETYRLGPGDLIGIVVFNEPSLSLQVRIDDTGIINYPFIGNVMANDRTTVEMGRDIRERLVNGKYLIQPEVTVNIINYRPFYIDGEVANPGGYPYEPGLTLRKAITLAGGFTERGSRSNISIIRGSDELDPTGPLLETPIRPDDIITIAERFF